MVDVEKPKIGWNDQKVTKGGMFLQHFDRFTNLLVFIDYYGSECRQGKYYCLRTWCSYMQQLFINLVPYMIDRNLITNTKDKTTLTVQESFTPYIDEIDALFTHGTNILNQAESYPFDEDENVQVFVNGLLKQALIIFDRINLMLNIAIQRVGLGIAQVEVITKELRKEQGMRRAMGY